MFELMQGFDHSLFTTICIVVFLYFGYKGASLIVFLSLGLFYFLVIGLNPVLLSLYLALSTIFFVRPFRKYLVSSFLVSLIKKLGMLPKISETEEIALQAGNVWIEAELFSGRPNFKRIISEPYNNLTKAERDFMNNQVERLCAMTDDWQVFSNRDLSKESWSYIKKEKFFGMIIPKKYGGLGFSALGHSAVVAKLATRSQILAITVMVPNSLGPAELLLRYGTKKQKDDFLPKLANGKEIPCFGLTEPLAGSDATSIVSEGEVIKDQQGKIRIKLNFRKRYITLGAIATVIGLAFRLKDPKNILARGTNLGISCALIKSTKQGIVIRRHDPLAVPFVNATLIGTDVLIDLDDIIGGVEQVGEGWKMLMECLSIGRGISLPATSTGGAKMIARIVGDYAFIRRQFGLPIGKFEGIEEPMAEIAGLTYMLDAARIFTATSIDNGYRPAVANAIVKYHFTERFRDIVNHGMDILGGAAICRGPRNLLAHAYFGTPIAITVEGANIMTRSLIHFGQGAIRCHPYLYHEMKALMEGDLDKFDNNFFKHIGHLFRNKIRSVILSLSRGYLYSAKSFGFVGRYEAKLAWSSASFAYLADIAFAIYGGNIKRKEMLNGRFGDILSHMYLATSVLRRFVAEGQRQEDKDYLIWSMDFCLAEIQAGFTDIFANLCKGPIGFIYRVFGGFYNRLNPISRSKNDHLTHKLAANLMEDSKLRDRLTEDIFIPQGENEQLARLEHCFRELKKADKIYAKVKLAIKKGVLNSASEQLYQDAVKAKIITKIEKSNLEKLDKLQLDAVEVDSFELQDYLSHKMKKPIV
ncbi:MAG: acyl-CoA dehydrogenase [Rickettsiales bacterium]